MRNWSVIVTSGVGACYLLLLIVPGFIAFIGAILFMIYVEETC